MINISEEGSIIARDGNTNTRNNKAAHRAALLNPHIGGENTSTPISRGTFDNKIEHGSSPLGGEQTELYLNNLLFKRPNCFVLTKGTNMCHKIELNAQESMKVYDKYDSYTEEIFSRNDCYANAMILVNALLSEDDNFIVKYILGYMIDKDGCKFAHGFVKRGEVYIDPTYPYLRDIVESWHVCHEVSSDQIKKFSIAHISQSWGSQWKKPSGDDN